MSIPAAYGAEILATAMDVAKRNWRTSVSESTHFDRIAAMDRLRAAIDAGISAAKVATAAPEIPSQDERLYGTIQAKLANLEAEKERYRLTLAAIRDCKLTGVDYGDWVQSVAYDALDNELLPECYNCGTFVHEGPCVSEDEEEEESNA